jgi:hypothetical protein
MGCAGAACARFAASGVEKQLPGLGFYAFGDRHELRAAARSKGAWALIVVARGSARQIAKPPVWAGGLVLLVEEGAQMLASRRMTQFA